MSTRAIKPGSDPLVSVIIPTYNRAHTLSRAVDSVLAQTFKNFELLIVDDASTDATSVYLNTLLSQKNPVLGESASGEDPPSDPAFSQTQWPIRVLKNKKNLGVSAARNIGIENSQGEWLAFLDSDDEWLPQKLSLQMEFVGRQNQSNSGGNNATKNSDFRLVHGEELWIRNGVRVNQMNKHQKSGGRIFKRCVDICFIAPSAVLLNRSLLADVGLFREDFPVCEDYELWLRVAALEEVGFIEEPLIRKYGGHEDQLSRSMVGMDLWRLRALLPFIKKDFVHQDYSKSTSSHVRDLLGGTFNEVFDLISEEERTYALSAALLRIEILRKGAEKHGNTDLLAEIEAISSMIH